MVLQERGQNSIIREIEQRIGEPMNQANENLAVQETQEEKVEQQPEQKTMVEEFRENNPKESEEETTEPIAHGEYRGRR